VMAVELMPDGLRDSTHAASPCSFKCGAVGAVPLMTAVLPRRSRTGISDCPGGCVGYMILTNVSGAPKPSRREGAAKPGIHIFQEPSMKRVHKFLLAAAVAVSGFGLSAGAADEKGHAMTGALIDNQCGAKQKTEAAALKHPLACIKKEACAASGYQLVVGDKHYKLDAAGTEKAKAFLADAKNNHVTIEGKMDGETLTVTSIAAAPDAK